MRPLVSGRDFPLSALGPIVLSPVVSYSLLTFLLLNQTFHPDVMATGQYLTEVAVRLVERGHQVTVVTSRRAYDHPETQFPGTENWRGIRIHRVGSTGFGKDAKWRRAADFASFIVCCCLRLVLLPGMTGWSPSPLRR